MLAKIISTVTVAVMITSLMGSAAWAQEEEAAEEQQAEQQKSPWKDQAEYDLYQSIVNEKDPAAKVKLLDKYSEAYTESQFKESILVMYTQAYQAQQQVDKMYEAVLELLKLNPKNMTGLYFVTTLTLTMADTSAERLATGEKYSNALLDEIKAMVKPENQSAADFKKQNDALALSAHTTLGWIAMSRKENKQAEQEFTQVLQLQPNNAQASYWLGSVIVAQRIPEKQVAAFYHFARAGNVTGEGAMPESSRKDINEYLRKNYTAYHGDESGLKELIAMAVKNQFPPADLVVKTKEQLAFEADEKLRKENPALALWLGIRDQLAGADGAQYFANSMQNTRVGGLRGYIISQSPAERPDTLVLGLTDRNTREVTITLDAPFRYPAGRGTPIRFQGCANGIFEQPLYAYLRSYKG